MAGLLVQFHSGVIFSLFFFGLLQDGSDIEEKAGVSLVQHPLAIKLQSCDTIEAITDFMQDQAQVFRHFRGSDQVMESWYVRRRS